MTETTGTSLLCVYEFTAPCEKIEFDDLKNFLKLYCKKWVFQKEKSESGYIHYQGKLSLTKKKRFSTMKNFVAEHISGMHVLPTVTQNMGLDFYVTKEETRIEGPWNDKDEAIVIALPRHLKNEPEWYPWQKTIKDGINSYEERIVNVVYDPHGNNGKTTLAMWLAARQLANKLPILNDSKDLMRMVMGLPKLNCYFLDMPRGLEKKKLANFYAAIEDIKNGYAWDDRYAFKQAFFDPPQIWVFTNSWPDIKLLSIDRWRFWRICPQTKKLISQPLTDLRGDESVTVA